MPRRRRRPITAEDLFRIEVVSDPQISPDGRRVAYVVTEIDRDANGYRSTIWVAPIEGGEPRAFTRGSRCENYPRWSPDGRFLAFISDRAGGKAQLQVMAIDGGEARQLTSLAEGVRSIAWSPTGDRLAFVARARPGAGAAAEQRPPAIREITRIKHKTDGQGLVEGQTHLFVVPTAGGEPKQITAGDWDDYDPAWAPDGASIAFASNRSPNRDWNDASDVWTVPSSGGRARRVTDGRHAYWAPAWSPDGQQLACLGRAETDPSGANVRIWMAAATGRDLRCLTPELDRSVGSDVLSDLREPAAAPRPVWSPDGSCLRFVASDHGNTHLFELELPGGTVRRPVSGDREVFTFSVSADGRRIAFGATDPLDPGNVFVADADGTHERRLTDLNRAFLDDVDLVAPERLEFPGANGQIVEGWLLPGRGDGRRPTILQIHGGPHALYGNAFFHELQLLAGHGYNVVYTNPRGSRGYGERFCSEIAGAWGELDYADLMAAVDLVVSRPDVDPDRLGVAGGSYGGFMTNWIVGHSDRFKAAVSMRGLSNFLSMYGTSDIGTFFLERELLGDPHGQAERYLRLSPISYVDRITTPVLIMHGEQDLRCPLEQAEQLFVALRRRGKTAELLRFPEESHNLSRSGRPDRRLLRLERLVGWFDRWLASDESDHVWAHRAADRTLVFGHRGAMGYAPENTMASFRKAVELGVDAIELDVHLTADDQVVVVHDPNLERTTSGHGKVRELRLEQIRAFDAGAHRGPGFAGERVPTLDEVLAWARDRCVVDIEIKGAPAPYLGIEERVVEAVVRHGMLDRAMVISFDHPTVRRVKALASDLACGVLYNCRPIDAVALARAASADALLPQWSHCVAEDVRRAQAAGLSVHPWATSESVEIRALLEMGVDSIASNHPDRVVAELARRPTRLG